MTNKDFFKRIGCLVFAFLGVIAILFGGFVLFMYLLVN